MQTIIRAVAGLTLLIILSTACNSERVEYIGVEGAMIGTTYHITAELPVGSESEVRRRAEELDARLKREMSIFNPDSQLSKINRGESDRTTLWIEQNIRLADSISRLSGGVYDITVAPLVEAWGFGGSYNAMIEGEVATPNIDSLLKFVGYEGITLKDGAIIKRDIRTQIDLNSIAKGFAVDRLGEIIEELGSINYMVDIGGELVLKGNNPSGGAWRVGIESPIDGNMTNGEFLEQRIAISQESELRAIATSGNYRRFYISKDGEKIVHTINPLTGHAESSTLLSVTVLAPTCAEADGYATMLLAAGDKRAEKLASEIENCEVYLIYNNARANEDGENGYREYFSEGMQSRLMDKIGD
ncbi:MAG: FAD:protein FMN transferase [Rikenellaceae bacterium]